MTGRLQLYGSQDGGASALPRPLPSCLLEGSRVLLAGTSLALLGDHIFLSLQAHNELLFAAAVEEGSLQLPACSLPSLCILHTAFN